MMVNQGRRRYYTITITVVVSIVLIIFDLILFLLFSILSLFCLFLFQIISLISPLFSFSFLVVKISIAMQYEVVVIDVEIIAVLNHLVAVDIQIYNCLQFVLLSESLLLLSSWLNNIKKNKRNERNIFVFHAYYTTTNFSIHPSSYTNTRRYTLKHSFKNINMFQNVQKQ